VRTVVRGFRQPQGIQAARLPLRLVGRDTGLQRRFQNRWLEVLKAGGSVKPLELMRRAGIDLEDPETIRKAVDYVGQLVDEVENSFLEDH
jgi:oligoendopeptidase F